MKQFKIFPVFGFFMFYFLGAAKAQQPVNTSERLDDKLQHIITISALAATGNLVQLQPALHNGLNDGLTINQIKEALVHLYAYCGFPRSIRGLQTLIAVLQERKGKNITDTIGAGASPGKSEPGKYERGREILGTLTGLPQDAPPTGYSAFAPAIDTFLKEHLFADLFERDVLNYAERELVTISVLSSIGGVEPMLRSHLQICLNVGITAGRLQHFVRLIQSAAGKKAAKSTQAVLDEVLKNNPA